MAFRFGGLARAVGSGMQGAQEIERQRKEDAEKSEAREIQKMAQMMAFREMGLMPESEAPTVSDDPVIQGFQGLKPKAVASVRTPRTDPDYKPIGTAGGQRYVQGPKPAEIVAQRQQAETIRKRMATLRALPQHRGSDPEALQAIAMDDDAWRDAIKPQTPKGPVPGSPEYFAMKRTEAGINAEFRPEPQEPIAQVIGPNGRPVYVERSDAIGKEVPSPSGMGSASIKTKVAGNRQQMSVIDDALRELDEYPEAVGLTRGLPFIGDRMDTRADPRGVAARAQIANIGSLKIHDRSGAAVSVHEFPRLAPFIPAIYDTPEAIKTKLAKLRQAVELETQELERSGTVAPRAVAEPEEFSDAEVLAAYNAGHKTDEAIANYIRQQRGGK